ncbi:MAG: cupin-like domain-containing protein [Sphingopyxis sp.]
MARQKRPPSAPVNGAGGGQSVLVAAALASGADDAGVLAQLCAAGLSPARAQYELDRAARDPVACALRTAAARLAKREWIFANAARLARQNPAALRLNDLALDMAGDGGATGVVAQFYDQFYALNRPARLLGLTAQWPTPAPWALAQVAALCGGAAVEIQAQRDSADDYELAKDAHRRMVHMADFIAWLDDDAPSNDAYLTAYNSGTNSDALAPLWSMIGATPIVHFRRPRDGFFWLGPKGTLTPWHHDLTNNILLQLVGEKRVQMAPPWAISAMKNHHHCFSQWGNRDFAREIDAPANPPATAPENAPTSPADYVVETVIGPGQAVFLPVGWWHRVESLSPSLSISFTGFAHANDHADDYASYGPL